MQDAPVIEWSTEQITVREYITLQRSIGSTPESMENGVMLLKMRSKNSLTDEMILQAPLRVYNLWLKQCIDSLPKIDDDGMDNFRKMMDGS
jgi:hypothetical protein